jgi:lysophospholipase L1-like esterase
MKKIIQVFLVLSLLVIATVNAAPLERADIGATRKNDNGTVNTQWLLRHQQFANTVKTTKYNTILFGDSITAGWSRSPDFKTLGNTINFGIGGDRVEHLLWRVQNSEINKNAPKYIVVMIGRNNIRMSHQSEIEIARGIQNIVNTIKSKSPTTKITLHPIFPPINSRVSKINLIIRNMTSSNVRVVDMTSKYLLPNGRTNWSLFIDVNNVHLSNSGYNIWAKTLRPIILK